jgi:hypothetical protein
MSAVWPRLFSFALTAPHRGDKGFYRLHGIGARAGGLRAVSPDICVELGPASNSFMTSGLLPATGNESGVMP